MQLRFSVLCAIALNEWHFSVKWFSRWELQIAGRTRISRKGQEYPNERPRPFFFFVGISRNGIVYTAAAQRGYDLSIYFSPESRRSTVSR